MNNSQFTSIVQMIARTYNPDLQSHEADIENMNLEVILSFGKIEKELLRYYIGLDEINLSALSPNVHVWFLRRIETSSLPLPTEYLTKAFLCLPHRLCRYLTIKILTEKQNTTSQVDQEQLHQDVSYPIVRLWNKINTTKEFSNKRPQLLKELSIILVDIKSNKSEAALDKLESITTGKEREIIQEARDLDSAQHNLAFEETQQNNDAVRKLE